MISQCPPIGSRVKVRESSVRGAVTGTVTKIYRQYEWDEINNREGALLPESDWAVCVKVDKVPAKWPYPETDLFAPPVSYIEGYIP